MSRPIAVCLPLGQVAVTAGAHQALQHHRWAGRLAADTPCHGTAVSGCMPQIAAESSGLKPVQLVQVRRIPSGAEFTCPCLTM